MISHVINGYNLTATEPGDYESGPYVVNFTKGQISAIFCIDIMDDEDLEMDETFTLRIDDTNLDQTDIVLKNPYIVNVTIIDDECKYLSYVVLFINFVLSCYP